ncbi:CdaR family protein [Clostridium tertium]|uniref:CdaR family protein n=1 Tax=Clostridium tertium TaxID=1559 RepID=UPI000C07FC85|nr:CdaR family protein [Clostridium tertium]MDB1921167.1 CdaR family protein [Clostridium tertium]MDB1925136.1 CdaR family protein [Clostridium tertium]MDB1928728.1 CdaR family protein [Clostridium tertium]
MDNKEKNRLVIPVICLLLSIGLWVYVTNVENKIRTTEISKIPVELINTEALTSSKLALTPNQELYVTLKVEGNTSDINKIKKSDFKVQVDLSEYAWKKGENKVPVSIVDYPITVSIRNTNTLTVSVKIEDMVEKTMPITSDIIVTPRQGYFASVATIDPKEVKVTGAESVVTRVSSLVVSDNKEDVFENVVGSYDIKPLDEAGNEVLGVLLSEKSANVEIKVSKGKSVKVNVVTTGQLPNGLKLKSIESNKKFVEILGPKEILDTISEVNSTPLNLSSINESKDVSLGIVIPEGLKLSQGEDYITVKVNVIKFATKDFNIKYSITGGIEGVKVTPAKDTIKVTISGYENELGNVTADNIKASIDVSAFKEDGSFEQEPKVTLQGLDESFSIVSVEKIAFTVTKEVAQNPSDTNNNANNNE